jgi:flagellar hook-associated protein 2
MGLSTNLISGLASGINWRDMIDQLMQVEHRRVDLVTNKKTEDESKLSEWQSFNTSLLTFKTAAEDLQEADDFNLFLANMSTNSSTVEASDLLSVSTSSSAAKGSYNLTISNLATAQKLSSNSFSSLTTALGSAYAGEIVINGKAVSIAADDDLADVRDKINNLNSGTTPTLVTASIVSYGTADHRLILTSDTTGASGISLLNGTATDVLGSFGLIETAAGSYDVKNSIAGGAQSDRFKSVSQTIKSLLGLSTAESTTTVRIKDAAGTYTNNISIDLATADLYDIRDAINGAKGSAGISASVVTETVDSVTYYRLQIEGIHASDPFDDDQNIFQTLGLIQGGVGDILGVKGTAAMTTGGAAVTASTKLVDIDGYLDWIPGDKIDFTGKNTANGDVSASFAITATSTVQELLDAIENAYGDVIATVTGDGRIQIADNAQTTGSSHLNVAFAESVANGTLDFGTFGAAATLRKREIVAGENAVLVVDGVTVTKTENTIDDVIAGVTLNLLKEDAGTTVTLNIDRDIDAVMEKINAMVTGYNEVSSYISAQQSYDMDTQEKGGVLFGDGTLSSIKSELQSTLIQTVWGVSSQFSSLGLIGINVDNSGALSIDSDKLKGYLRTNFNDVRSLFASGGMTSTGTLQYVTHSQNSQAGEYAIHITNAALRSTSTSNTAVSGTLGASETLTVTEAGKTATIDLTAAMTKTDIVNAVNAELDTVYTEILAGAESLYSDAGQAAAITSSTAWNSLYDSGGNSANMADGDVISFTGTNREGTLVSGSYTISDVAADTVQGLLSEIQVAFGNSISATVDSSGRIVITDKSTGNSSLSLTLDTSGAHDLDFGSVSSANTGGREGRYAIAVRASIDGSDRIVLTHDDYGSVYSFAISESADLLWTGGDQTVANGEDVAGTINGEAATGLGQNLTGNSGETNIDGLTIRYTGTAENVDAGTVKLTLGVAELFSRSLYGITDPSEGYLAYKQTSLQNEIDGYETKIEQMEALLERRAETMINRFVAMEVALSKIQQQSSWLAGQLSAAQSAWK